jgi:uncharacterized protein YrrD
MRFYSKARVISSDGESLGHLERVVIDARTDRVTHLVLEKGRLFTEERVISVDEVRSSSGERVKLDLTADELADAPRFLERDFVPLREEEAEELDLEVLPLYYTHPPGGSLIAATFPPFPEQPMVERKTRNVPDESVALRAGAEVYDAMGDHIGDVEQVLVDPQDDSVNHFIISRGVLLTERKVIPMAWVKDVQEGRIELGVSSQILDQLPGYGTQ